MNPLLEFAYKILSADGDCAKIGICDPACPAFFNVNKLVGCQAIPAEIPDARISTLNRLGSSFWHNMHVKWAKEYIEEQKKLDYLKTLE